jgi:O-antigen biosynthesis protein
MGVGDGVLARWGRAWTRFRYREVWEERRAGDRARDEREWTSAAAHYRRYLVARPDDVPILVQLGHALKEAGDLEGSAEAYDRALALAPNDPDLQLSLGHLAKRRGDWAEAAYRYRASYKLDPTPQARQELLDPAIDRWLDQAEERLAAEGR